MESDNGISFYQSRKEFAVNDMAISKINFWSKTALYGMDKKPIPLLDSSPEIE